MIRRLRVSGRPAPGSEDGHDQEPFHPFGTRDSLRVDRDRHRDRFGEDGDRDGDGPGGLKQWVGRHRTPVLAAAALTVALCVAVPMLLSGGSDGSHHRATESSGGNDPVSDPLGDLPPVLTPSGGEPSPSEGGEPSPSEGGRGKDRQAGKNDAGAAGDDSSPGQERPAGADADSSPAAGDDASGSGGRDDSEADGQPSTDGSAPDMTSVRTGQWETASHALAAPATGTCLAREDARAVGQGSCGPDRWSRHRTGADTYLLKHVGAKRCLDTDGSNLYLSDCTPEDSGQVWRLTAADGCAVTIVSVPFGTGVTAARGSATASSSGTAWRAPSLFDGC